MKLTGNAPCLGDIDCRHIAKRDAPRASHNVVLINPRARPALAQANTKAGDVVVEVDCFRPSPGKVAGKVFESEFHENSAGRFWGRSGEGPARGQAWPRLANSPQVSHILRGFTRGLWPSQANVGIAAVFF